MQNSEQRRLTSGLDRSTTCLSCVEDESELATGVTGKECVPLVEKEEKTLVKENCLDVDGLPCCPSEDGVPGIRRTVLSPSGAELFVFRLRCGKKLLMDDFVLVELGLGGKPALTEPGLDKKRHQVTRRRKNPRSGDLPQRSGGQRRRLPRSGVGRSQSRSDSGHLESNGTRLNECR
ncbi:hypothetical protein B296_00042048 [Ensete ventricosum]|uniref:Uncharacterized protein n=1 Tax=Ensete ventricosum TaxID=4639 RepID=A0A426YE01_ENSVE|nr:hypothetical protein B296_00042048 [Ensete ventricosum]